MQKRERSRILRLFNNSACQGIRYACQYIGCIRKCNAITPHFVLCTVRMQAIVPFCHCCHGVRFCRFSIYSRMCVANLLPESKFLVRHIFFIVRNAPAIRKSLQTAAFQRGKTANDVLAWRFAAISGDGLFMIAVERRAKILHNFRIALPMRHNAYSRVIRHPVLMISGQCRTMRPIAIAASVIADTIRLLRTFRVPRVMRGKCVENIGVAYSGHCVSACFAGKRRRSRFRFAHASCFRSLTGLKANSMPCGCVQRVHEAIMRYAQPVARPVIVPRRTAALAACGLVMERVYHIRAIPTVIASSSASRNIGGNCLPRFSARRRMPLHAFALK